MGNQARTTPPNQEWRNKTNPKTSRFFGIPLVVTLVLTVSAARAQDINETVTIEDLGFTQRLIAGARPAGLAGAYVGIGQDAYSLIYNPAGLVGVGGAEFSVGLQHQRRVVGNDFYGTSGDVDLATTKLDEIAFAYPVPTAHGRFVVAGGIYQKYSSDFDLLNEGFNSFISASDDYRLQQSGSTYSYNLGAGVDVSPRLAIGVNLFFLYGRVDALTQFTYDFDPAPPPGGLARVTLVDDARLNIRGVGAVLGFLYHPSEALSFGLVTGTPTAIDIRRDALQQNARYFIASADSFFTGEYELDRNYKLPFYVAAGVSLSTRHVLLSFEAEYSNWAEAEINGRQIKDRDLRAVFRDVVDIRAGVELNMGSLFMRGGYAYTPYPLQYLQADRIEDPGERIVPLPLGTQLQDASIDTELQSISAGIGLKLVDALTIDASLQYRFGERSIPTLVDKREMYRIVFSGSYRL